MNTTTKKLFVIQSGRSSVVKKILLISIRSIELEKHIEYDLKDCLRDLLKETFNIQ